MDYQQILKKLENIVAETFYLWDHKRVGFYWPHYYLDHTLRVRAMSLEIGKKTGADLTVLAFAATLHDITKRYDGGILTDAQGNRVLDENGLWKNEMVLPSKSNVVTNLYHENDLYYKQHNVSGALIADRLLSDYGLPRSFIDPVTSVMKKHLKPDNLPPDEVEARYKDPESRALYDADIMDANLGYVAFHRNIHIHTYNMKKKTGKADLITYIDVIPNWVNMKKPFVDKLFTEAAREVATSRHLRKVELCSKLDEEKKDIDLNRNYGLLGAIDYFMGCTDDPNFRIEMDHLRDGWIPERKERLKKEENHREGAAKEALGRVEEFHSTIEREAVGLL